jgi:hypothetical protein
VEFEGGGSIGELQLVAQHRDHDRRLVANGLAGRKRRINRLELRCSGVELLSAMVSMHHQFDQLGRLAHQAGGGHMVVYGLVVDGDNDIAHPESAPASEAAWLDLRYVWRSTPIVVI